MLKEEKYFNFLEYEGGAYENELIHVTIKWEDKTGNLENYAHLLQDVQTDLII